MDVTPVQKVIQMLEDMKMKGGAQINLEQKTFQTYKEWVDSRVTDLGFEIKTTKSEIEKLLAFIGKADSDAAELATAIRELDGEISKTEAAQKAATDIRGKSNAEYQVAQEDLSESVDALQRAIQVMKSQNYARPQAAALLQKMAAEKGNKGMRRVLAAFLEMDASSASAAKDAPAVAAYEYQSTSIVDMLEDLLDKFKEQLSDTETQESNQAHNYDLEMLHLGNMAERLTSDREEKAALRGKTVSESGEAKGQLAAAKADLSEDEKLLQETKATFAAKTQVFEENQKVRAEELEALGKAIDIISDPSVSDSYAEHVKLAQLSKKGGGAVSFLQRASRRTAASLAAAQDGAKKEVTALLKQKASELRSSVLLQAAQQVGDSPFGKVIEMIESLLAKLKEEAAAEADHKAWCDDELQKNKLKRDEKGSAVAQLQTETEKLAANIAGMANEIKTLSEEQSSLAKAMNEATSFRFKEKQENEAAIGDATLAQQALKKAIVILREFYEKQQAGSAALLQQKQVPEMAAYKGMGSANGGVVGMLEVIESDFLRVETETKTAEATAAQQYEEFMSDSQAATKQKHDREFKLSLEKDQTEFELDNVKKDLSLTQEELDKAMNYYDKLKPSCIEVHVSYEERVARRKQEIEALKEAYKVLDGLSK
eukprot:TRINITY_DN18032_c0_g1_i2.p2 TRINITY_DN18032_c0_g1~~TRINITY_DN18032_c0_g1_i2.p2  ORF type:complete len:700 (+),score=346.23 TRINITY_DN18032_c0_g1_i2:131-2101(+)